jgi:hypothetical protein
MSARRIYTIPFRNVSVSAVQDMIAAYAGSSMAIELVSLSIGQITHDGSIEWHDLDSSKVALRRTSALVHRDLEHARTLRYLIKCTSPLGCQLRLQNRRMRKSKLKVL